MINGTQFKDSRLLESLDYIDSALIADAMGALKINEEAHIAKTSKFRRIKAYVTLAACLVLLSAAFPIASYLLPRLGLSVGGNAGAGTEELETMSKVIDSPYERSIYAYPEGMSAAEIYTDVLKGGWVVNVDGKITAEEKLWEDFLRQTKNKTKASILIALYDENREAIFLKSVSYNGEVYNCDLRYICQPESKDRISSFSAKYLVCHDMTSSTYEEKRNWDPPTQFVWFLTDYPEIPYIEQLIVYESEHYEFLKDNYPTFWDLIWLYREPETADIDFDEALERYADMSAEEIYADVLKGGWIVQDSDLSSVLDAGEDLWQEFLLSVDNKKPTTVLLADFILSNSCIYLSKICYNGEYFIITKHTITDASIVKTVTKEFKYLLHSKLPCYFFANDLDADPLNVISSDHADSRKIETCFVAILSEKETEE